MYNNNQTLLDVYDIRAKEKIKKLKFTIDKVQRQPGGTGSKTGTEREIAGIARADGGRGCPSPEIRI